MRGPFTDGWDVRGHECSPNSSTQTASSGTYLHGIQENNSCETIVSAKDMSVVDVTLVQLVHITRFRHSSMVGNLTAET
jgi:hypothetical protein